MRRAGPAAAARRPTLRRAAVALVAGLLAALLPAAARADVDVAARLGHGGVCIQDAATPLDVDLRNSGTQAVTVTLVVTSSGGVGEDSFRYERKVVVGGGAARRESFLVAGPSSWLPSGSVAVTTEPRTTVRHRRGGILDAAPGRSGDRGVLSIPFSEFHGSESAAGAFEQRRAVGVLHDRRSTIAAALAALAANEAEGAAARAAPPRALAVDPETLRLAPLSLDGIECLVVCDPDDSFCEDPAVLDGLLDWVALGGRLVVSLGEHAPAFASSPLAEWLPARWAGVDRGDYAEIAPRLPGSPSYPDGARVVGPQARVVEHTRNGIVALVPGHWIERRLGSGKLVVLGFDLRLLAETLPQERRPLGAIARIVADSDVPTNWTGKRAWEIATFDVAGRVGTALQQDAFRPPPIFAVVLGLFAYVLVVGPVDWFVLRRIRKERLTTFTFAGAVAAFTVLAYGVSILLFSSDAVVNRVTFIHSSDGGRPGREVIRVHDLAGYYAPTGGTRDLEYPLPAAVLGGNLPGLHSSGGVGASLPVVVRGPDPLRSAAEVEVAFRSQRVVHAVAAGTTGRTIALERAAPGGPLVVTNALPVDLADCWVLLPGGTGHRVGPLARGASWEASRPPVAVDAIQLAVPAEVTAFGGWGRSRAEEDRETFRRFLAMVATSPVTSPDRPPSGWEALRRAGILRDAPREGRALLVAVADESPVALPEGDAKGTRSVVLTREVELP